MTPAWQCRWWRAWSAWARGGETPDADALARDLLRLVRESEERRRYLAVIDGTDGLSLREGAQALSTMTGTPVEECESSMRAAMGRVLLPAFGDMIDAVHEFMGEHEATVAATVPSLLDRITSTEAPAEPQRGGPPVGGRLARRLRKRRE